MSMNCRKLPPKFIFKRELQTKVWQTRLKSGNISLPNKPGIAHNMEEGLTFRLVYVAKLPLAFTTLRNIKLFLYHVDMAVFGDERVI